VKIRAINALFRQKLGLGELAQHVTRPEPRGAKNALDLARTERPYCQQQRRQFWNPRSAAQLREVVLERTKLHQGFVEQLRKRLRCRFDRAGKRFVTFFGLKVPSQRGER
jgi:hypothetical protein